MSNNEYAFEYVITATCERGHVSTLTIDGHTRQYVDMLAALMDGSAFPPLNPEAEKVSTLGKCSWNGCGAKFKCEVMQLEQPPA